MLPLGSNQRPRLFAAALKLLRFALGLDQVRFRTEAEEALGNAMRPLLQLQDEHVLATLSAVVLALKEGRTGLPIGGVFGAGKTRSAAVLLAGLLVFDPSLKLMVVTKENVAAHAAAAVLRMQWGQHEEQPKAPPARAARRDRVPPGVIAPQGEEEQGAEEEEASLTCTDSEDSSEEQDGSPQDTTRTPLSEWAHVGSLS